MSDLDINEMLRPDGIVPIDRATTQALVRECFKLRKERSELLEALRLCVAVLDNGADDLGAKDAAIAALSKAQGAVNVYIFVDVLFKVCV